MLQNLEEENIVTIKKPNFISRVEPYIKEGFESMDMGLNLFETGSLLNFFPLTNSLMYDDNSYDSNQYSIYVSEETIKQLDKEEVEKRISKQLQEDIKMKLCDYVITNNEQELIIPQVLELDNKFRELANKHCRVFSF